MSAIIIKNALIRLGLTATPELREEVTADDFIAYSGMLNYYGNISSETAANSIENLDVLPDQVIAMLQNPLVTEISLDIVQAATSGELDVRAAFVSPRDVDAYTDFIAAIQEGTLAATLPDQPAPVAVQADEPAAPVEGQPSSQVQSDDSQQESQPVANVEPNVEAPADTPVLPTEGTAVEEAPVESAPSEDAPQVATPAAEEPVADAPSPDVAADAAPAEQAPVVDTPAVEAAPVADEAPADEQTPDQPAA